MGKTISNRGILYCFVGLALLIFVANQLGEETTIIVGNVVYLPVSVAWLVLSIFLVKQHKLTGKHGKAWFFFLGSAASFFIAESVWMYEELILEIEPYPSTADLFYLIGYPFFFLFSVFYINPVKKAISKNMTLGAICISVTILTPTLYLSIFSDDIDTEISTLELVLGASYPIADSIVIIPAIIGMALFFKGEVNFLWSLVFLGFLFMAAADTAFLLAQMEDFYYTGHPLEILFYWSYLCFAFGAYNHYKIFKTLKQQKKSSQNL